MNSGENVSAIRVCKFCDVTCSRKNDWDRHLLTAKHIKHSTFSVSADTTKHEYTCEKCDYTCNKLSLWEKHILTKTCRFISTNDNFYLTILSNPIFSFKGFR